MRRLRAHPRDRRPGVESDRLPRVTHPAQFALAATGERLARRPGPLGEDEFAVAARRVDGIEHP